jgi:hypothetical protein
LERATGRDIYLNAMLKGYLSVMVKSAEGITKVATVGR